MKQYKMDEGWGVLWLMEGDIHTCMHDFGTCSPTWKRGYRTTLAVRDVRNLTPTEEIQYRLEGWLC